MKNIKNTINWIKRISFFACAGMLLFLCVACGQEQTAASVGNSPGNEQDTIIQITDPEGNQPLQEGGSLFVSMPVSGVSFHPLDSQSEDMFNLLSLVAEPALRINSLHKIEPALVETWEIGEDGLTYTFHLRKGVKFHDGSEFTAEDLMFTLDEIMKQAGMGSKRKEYVEPDVSASPQPSDSNDVDPANTDNPEPSLQPQKTDDPKQAANSPDQNNSGGGQEQTRNAFIDGAELIASYAKKDDATVILTATKKTNKILYFMNFPVLSKNYYQNLDLETKKLPMGTGPYQAVSYSAEEGLTLERNTVWWKTQPVFSKIVAQPAKSQNEKLTHYQQALVDLVVTDSLTADSYRLEGKTSISDITSPYYGCLIPNMRTRVLGDQNVRQAVSFALDRKEIIEQGLFSQGIVTTTPLCPDTWLAQSAQTGVDTSDQTEEANRLLEEKGYTWKDGAEYRTVDGAGVLTFDLLFCEAEDIYYRQTVADLIAAQLKKIGIQVNVVIKPYDEYVKALADGDFDMALAEFYMPKNLDISFLFEKGREYNYGGAQAEDLLALLERLDTTMDEAEQVAVYKEVYEALERELPQIGLYYKQNAVIHDANIKNIKQLAYLDIYANMNEWTVE